MSALEQILDERGNRYGRFDHHAEVTQALKGVMRGDMAKLTSEVSVNLGSAWDDLCPDQKETLEMIVHKIGRVLNGDPDYVDSWADIAGYAKLVADRLEGVSR